MLPVYQKNTFGMITHCLKPKTTGVWLCVALLGCMCIALFTKSVRKHVSDLKKEVNFA